MVLTLYNSQIWAYCSKKFFFEKSENYLQKPLVLVSTVISTSVVCVTAHYLKSSKFQILKVRQTLYGRIWNSWFLLYGQNHHHKILRRTLSKIGRGKISIKTWKFLLKDSSIFWCKRKMLPFWTIIGTLYRFIWCRANRQYRCQYRNCVHWREVNFSHVLEHWFEITSSRKYS